MRFKYDGKLLARYMKEKRVIDLDNNISLSLGQAAKQIKISKATLSRLERGYMPDAVTLRIICGWIDKPMELFFLPLKSNKKI